MARECCSVTSREEATVRFEIGNQGERMKIAAERIARRAFEIFESRGRAPFHETEDWLRAEAEILRTLSCVYCESGGKTDVTTNIKDLEKKDIVVSIEPRRLMVSGRIAARPGKTSRYGLPGELIFLVFEVPYDIEPSLVTAKFKNCILEIELYKARVAKVESKQAKAA